MPAFDNLRSVFLSMRTQWKRFIPWLAISVVVGGMALAGWAVWWEPRRLVVIEDTIDLPCWTGDPLLLAIVSDLHVGSPAVGLARVDHLVGVINAARPDAILLLGDFVIQGVAGGRFVPPETIARHLNTLKAPLGVYAVLGNHDWWLDERRVTSAFTAEGIPVIDDAVVPLKFGSNSFWLMGISDFWRGRQNVARTLTGVANAAPVIAMTHNPDVFPNVPARVCLTLAGHTHGGQVALPMIGAPVVPSKFGQRYAKGHIEEDGRHLYVTTGVGTSILPVRFRVPPEVLLLRLR